MKLPPPGTCHAQTTDKGPSGPRDGCPGGGPPAPPNASGPLDGGDPQVEDPEEEDPDDVHEVPVERRGREADVVLAVEVALQGAAQHEAQEDQASGDVGAVEAGHRE